MLKESSDDHDHDDTPACTPTPPMLRLYVTQVDDNGNDAISIDEWLEFWRNVLAQATLASQQASHQPKVTLTHQKLPQSDTKVTPNSPSYAKSML